MWTAKPNVNDVAGRAAVVATVIARLSRRLHVRPEMFGELAKDEYFNVADASKYFRDHRDLGAAVSAAVV